MGDETITYVLKADVTGTQDNKLAKYIIADDMDTDNLSLADVEIQSVQLVNGTTADDIEYTYTLDEADLGSEKGYSYDFGVSIAATELEKNSFYTKGNQVVVTFTTKLTDAAKEGFDIINKDGLKYENNLLKRLTLMTRPKNSAERRSASTRLRLAPTMTRLTKRSPAPTATTSTPPF